MKIAICDDVVEFSSIFKKYIENYIFEKNIINYNIDIFSSGAEFICTFEPEKYDFIFLDVDMPELNGFDTAEAIKKLDRSVFIIFVTNMQNQMHQGFKYNAKDYMLKPATQESINILLDRMILEKNENKQNGFYSVKIKKDGVVFIRNDDILYFESNGHDISAVVKGDRFTFIGKMDKVYEEMRDKGFVRIHQSYIVNLEHVFKDLGKTVLLKKDGELPVSIKYKKALREAFRVWGQEKWKI